jgi:hypothetical protein
MYLETTSRIKRFERMMTAFFPEFRLPQNADRLDRLMGLRNEFTHELIVVTDAIAPPPPLQCLSHQDIDDFFHSAGEFILAMMESVPGDLVGPLRAFDARYSPNEALDPSVPGTKEED